MSKFDIIDNVNLVSNVINNLVNEMQLDKINVYGKSANKLNIFSAVSLEYIDDISKVTSDFVYIYCDGDTEWENLSNWVNENKDTMNCVLYLRNLKDSNEITEILGKGASLKYYDDEDGQLFFLGKILKGPGKNSQVPSDFNVLAIVHIYNEIDVVDNLCKYLFDQGVDIYFVDNWSDDGTYEKLCELKNIYPNIVSLERFPTAGKNDSFELYNQLKRSEEISRELDYRWYLHYDADEMRISPWKNVTLRQAIHHVDMCGFNQIGMYTIAYKLTDYSNDNIFMSDTFFEFGTKKTYYSIKMWKKSLDIDLKESGGHMAVVKNPRRFPLLFLNRHYPFRSLEQARKKVFRDRKPRFEKEKKEKGWHGHYDKLNTNEDFICKKENLFLWNSDSFYDYYIPFFCNCGIKVSDDVICDKNMLSGFDDSENCDIVIFGAGVCGMNAYLKYAFKNNVVAWIDKKFEVMSRIFAVTIQAPEIIIKLKYDYILIAIKNQRYVKEVIRELLDFGVKKEKIVILK